MRAWIRRWLGLDEIAGEMFVVCERREPKCVCATEDQVREALASLEPKFSQVFRVPLR